MHCLHLWLHYATSFVNTHHFTVILEVAASLEWFSAYCVKRQTVMHAKYTRQWSNNGARILVACPQYDCERQALTSLLVPIKNKHPVKKCYWTIDHTYQ